MSFKLTRSSGTLHLNANLAQYPLRPGRSRQPVSHQQLQHARDCDTQPKERGLITCSAAPSAETTPWYREHAELWTEIHTEAEFQAHVLEAPSDQLVIVGKC